MNKILALFFIIFCHNAWAFNPEFCDENAPVGIKKTITDIIHSASNTLNGNKHSCEQLVANPNGVQSVNIAQSFSETAELQEYDLSPLLELPDLWKIYIADSDVMTRKNKDVISHLKNLLDFSVHVRISKAGDELQDLTFLIPHSKRLMFLKLANLSTIGGKKGPIKDIEPLKKFTKLIDLNLMGMDISTVRPLMSMGNLLYLTLDGNNNLMNLDGIQHLVNLESFSFRCETDCDMVTRNNCRACNRSQFIDFSYLKNLSFLKLLNVSNNKIKDISFLSKMENLETLDLSNNEIADGDKLISYINSMKDLNSLNVSNNSLNHFEQVVPLNKIETLILKNNNLTEFNFNNFPSLTSFSLSYNRLKSITPPSQRRRFKQFELRNNRLKNLDLTNFDLSEARTIELSSNLLTDFIIDEENLSDEVSIYLNSNKFAKIPVFSNSTKIREINLANNELEGNVEIGHLKGIKSLDLSMNKIESISSNEAMELTSLECSYNNLSNLNLENFQSLEYLDASHNKINTVSVVSDFRFLDLSFNELKDINPISASAYSKINLAHNFLNTVPTFTNDRLGMLDLSSNPLLNEARFDQFKTINELKIINENLRVTSLPNSVRALEVGKINPQVLSPSLLARLESIIFDYNSAVLSLLNSSAPLSVLGINNLDKFDSLSSLDIKVLALNEPKFELDPEKLSDILPNLEVLALKKTKFKNLNLKNFKNLSGLIINESELNTIPELGQNVEGITHLDFSSNNIAQIISLKDYKNLKALNLSYNPVVDLKPLNAISLKTLNLNGTLVDNLWPISHMNLSPLTFVNTPVYKNPSNSNCPMTSTGNVDNYCRVLVNE
ncbi:MAG: hypothetical protein COW00_05170 [Bdellovibrio sp. CG12_big_fil_rev_8_21_14_0_65_39_13]|nr:MAG: hypothetical protein COW78_13370 [Bdellovibrio sp. CG22_combo_CG10-13_8_21_14_all_39_27]PIQ61200.1 MAG: hypothetical protein COW00_05170 [Bdellovibrio sp. CG12_big_fil_rev_8_21_14_0_65_39_13]PIR34870.1 MAG: hypothetical protein COV37_11445 [Bdellovibrio sp. CG11_big_fil_rev_8_21_14_0_20_39_38]PJB54298.1 MAG: hypothetical protein CO099_02375 [Bdellovibrio sp. CG_4_9_14_3_um_filter_39_7]